MLGGNSLCGAHGKSALIAAKYLLAALFAAISTTGLTIN